MLDIVIKSCHLALPFAFITFLINAVFYLPISVIIAFFLLPILFLPFFGGPANQFFVNFQGIF